MSRLHRLGNGTEILAKQIGTRVEWYFRDQKTEELTPIIACEYENEGRARAAAKAASESLSKAKTCTVFS